MVGPARRAGLDPASHAAGDQCFERPRGRAAAPWYRRLVRTMQIADGRPCRPGAAPLRGADALVRRSSRLVEDGVDPDGLGREPVGEDDGRLHLLDGHRGRRPCPPRSPERRGGRAPSPGAGRQRIFAWSRLQRALRLLTLLPNSLCHCTNRVLASGVSRTGTVLAHRCSCRGLARALCGSSWRRHR